MVLKSDQDLLDCVRLHAHDCFYLFLAQLQAQLLEHLHIERVPIVGLLRDRVRLTVVVHVD